MWDCEITWNFSQATNTRLLHHPHYQSFLDARQTSHTCETARSSEVFQFRTTWTYKSCKSVFCRPWTYQSHTWDYKIVWIFSWPWTHKSHPSVFPRPQRYKSHTWDYEIKPCHGRYKSLVSPGSGKDRYMWCVFGHTLETAWSSEAVPRS